MTAATTGLWAARNKVSAEAPLVPGVDPEHLTPTDHAEYQHMAPAWQSTVDQPGLPDDMLAVPVENFATGIGPVDNTPLDHGYGVGVGSGLTTLESQDRMAAWHNDNHGSVAAHTYNHVTDRDGTYNVEMIPDDTISGDSPQTVALLRTGVGMPNDPFARSAKRYKRWWDRYINYHRWDSQPGPVRPQFARPNPSRTGVDGGNQMTPPYGNSVQSPIMTPDKFVMQQIRRTPEGWTDNQAGDGTDVTLIGATNDYGLKAWGL